MYVMYSDIKTLYIVYKKISWQGSVICVFSGAILETEGSIWQ